MQLKYADLDQFSYFVFFNFINPIVLKTGVLNLYNYNIYHFPRSIQSFNK